MCPNAITEEIDAALSRASGDVNAAELKVCLVSFIGFTIEQYSGIPRIVQSFTQQSSSANDNLDNLSPQHYSKIFFTVVQRMCINR
jgi:hypothetical protein